MKTEMIRKKRIIENGLKTFRSSVRNYLTRFNRVPRIGWITLGQYKNVKKNHLLLLAGSRIWPSALAISRSWPRFREKSVNLRIFNKPDKIVFSHE